jgi:signal transduction histidine kinase
MISLYYCLVLLNAAVCLAVATAAWWRNRYQAIGPLFGWSMTLVALWLFGFAQYFRQMDRSTALLWAKFTLTAGPLATPWLFHSMCAYAGQVRKYRLWIAVSHGLAVLFLVLLWKGLIVTGVRPYPAMDHYVHYNRALYPVVSFNILFWQVFGVVVLVSAVRESHGYKRTQFVYFIVVWLIISLTTNSIIVPLEYGINIPQFGWFILPLILVAMAYVMGKRRLADYNVVIARILLHSVTLLVVVVGSLLAIAGMTVIAPGFMNPSQILFTVTVVVGVGIGLAFFLPRFLPRAERMMQERMFGKRYGYQDALSTLVKELSHLPNIDEMLQQVATALHSQMQVSRVLVLMQDPLSGEYGLQAESGLTVEEQSEELQLTENTSVIRWLRDQRDTLVRDELARRVSPQVLRSLDADLNRLKVAVCVPMLLPDQLSGLICLGEKANRDMFFVSDLRLLETLSTEVALAVKYRRMEDQIFRKNKLIELGTIAAGVAHEIRNPLASIRTFAQLMPNKMDDPEFTGEFSKLVLKDVDRITRVVESMLAFARPAQVTIAEHPATEIVEEAVLLVQPRIKSKRIELTKHFHEQPILRVDKQQILQVLVNLLNNASDALPEHGKIRIATGIGVMEGASENNGSQRMAVIEVADNGPGIPAAVRNRLFDPFFTTKKEGTGLGLSISQKIARDHGGIITISSVEGKGTAFRVHLPLI